MAKRRSTKAGSKPRTRRKAATKREPKAAPQGEPESEKPPAEEPSPDGTQTPDAKPELEPEDLKVSTPDGKDTDLDKPAAPLVKEGDEEPEPTPLPHGRQGFVSVDEAAEFAGVSVKLIRRWMDRDLILRFAANGRERVFWPLTSSDYTGPFTPPKDDLLEEQG